MLEMLILVVFIISCVNVLVSSLSVVLPLQLVVCLLLLLVVVVIIVVVVVVQVPGGGDD